LDKESAAETEPYERRWELPDYIHIVSINMNCDAIELLHRVERGETRMDIC
jgi:hypothetical protein